MASSSSPPPPDTTTATTTTTSVMTMIPSVQINSNSNSNSTTATTTTTSRNVRSQKRKKSTRTQSQSKRNGNANTNNNENNETEPHRKWKTDKQQQIYSSKLIQALTTVRLNPTSPSAPRRGRAVREAADRALAVAAKGRTRWSRAILSSRIKLKFRKQQRNNKNSMRRQRPVAATGSGGRKARVSVLRLKGKSVPAVQRKVKLLGRLVPGCRKQPLPVILEEATDYIAALEMQVRAMSALADLLSRSGSVSGNNNNDVASSSTSPSPMTTATASPPPSPMSS